MYGWVLMANGMEKGILMNHIETPVELVSVHFEKSVNPCLTLFIGK